MKAVDTPGVGAGPRPRLLYLTRVYPYRPAFGGEISYSRGVVEAVAGACDLTVLAATNGAAPVGTFSAGGARWNLVAPSRRISAFSLATGMPNLMWRNATPAYYRALRRLLEERWDGIILDHFASAHVLPEIVRWRDRNPDRRLLYLAHEHERTTRSEKYASYGGNLIRRAVMKIDGWKIGRWEDRVLAAMDCISLINPGEQPLFEAHVHGQHYVATVPGHDGARVAERRIDRAVPRRVALLGGRGSIHKQNILREWLAASVSRFAAAGIELDVIGDLPPALRRTLTRRYPSVRFSGFVEDLAGHLQSCRLGVVPDTVGRGVKVRLPSYIFSRVPLAGLAGAIDGLPIVAGRDFVEAEGMEALVSLCIALIDDLPALNRLQDNAYAACADRFDWAERGAALVAAVIGERVASHDPMDRPQVTLAA